MKATAITLLLICGGLTMAKPRSPQESAVQPTTCDEIKNALATVARIKVGMTRREVEQLFERDGGAQFALSGRYVYPNCQYIKIEIEFQNSDPSPQDPLLSPSDIVSKISKPYLEYPVKD